MQREKQFFISTHTPEDWSHVRSVTGKNKPALICQHVNDNLDKNIF